MKAAQATSLTTTTIERQERRKNVATWNPQNPGWCKHCGELIESMMQREDRTTVHRASGLIRCYGNGKWETLS